LDSSDQNQGRHSDLPQISSYLLNHVNNSSIENAYLNPQLLYSFFLGVLVTFLITVTIFSGISSFACGFIIGLLLRPLMTTLISYLHRIFQMYLQRSSDFISYSSNRNRSFNPSQNPPPYDRTTGQSAYRRRRNRPMQSNQNHQSYRIPPTFEDDLPMESVILIDSFQPHVTEAEDEDIYADLPGHILFTDDDESPEEVDSEGQYNDHFSEYFYDHEIEAVLSHDDDDDEQEVEAVLPHSNNVYEHGIEVVLSHDDVYMDGIEAVLSHHNQNKDEQNRIEAVLSYHDEDIADSNEKYFSQEFMDQHDFFIPDAPVDQVAFVDFLDVEENDAGEISLNWVEESRKTCATIMDKLDVSPLDEIYTTSDKPAQPLGIPAKRKRKYKPVGKKVKPAAVALPEEYRIIRRILSDSMLSLPKLPVNPPEPVPTEHITEERLKGFKLDDGSLWPEEAKLFKHMVLQHEEVFAWKETERRRFRDDYFPPVKIPVVEHTPWAHRNLPIPPGIRDALIKLLKEKIKAGVYEPSDSGYRSRWFCIAKKDGVSLRIVHDLQDLNAVTIKNAGLAPNPDTFSEECAGRTVMGSYDLYSSYDLQQLHESSRDLTTFQTPLGTLRQCALPMGWTNSVSIQQGNLVFILSEEIPEHANAFLDDIFVKGPHSYYLLEDGSYETIPENPGIRRFIWEMAVASNRVLQRLRQAGASISGKKARPCVSEIMVVGHRCSYEGRRPDLSNVQRILDWPPCKTLTEVRAFLGTCSVSRMWIKNFSKIARPLIDLTKKNGIPFYFSDDCVAAMEQLKETVSIAPCIRPIDYQSKRKVILEVDSSNVAVGYILSQIGEDGRRYPSRFGSIAWDSVESRYSQSKLELHGLFRALRAVRLYIFGVEDLEVELDAKYIKGMLSNPDVQPNATINRWIAGVLLFNPKIVHVPAAQHTRADGLSRRPKAPCDPEEDDDPDEWLDHALGLYTLSLETVNQLPNRSLMEVLYQVTRDNVYATQSKENDVIEEVDTNQIDEEQHGDEELEEDLESNQIFPNKSARSILRDNELPSFKIFLESLETPPDFSKQQRKHLSTEQVDSLLSMENCFAETLS